MLATYLSFCVCSGGVGVAAVAGGFSVCLVFVDEGEREKFGEVVSENSRACFMYLVWLLISNFFSLSSSSVEKR